MLSSLQVFLITECCYQLAYNVLFFGLFCRKVLKLDKLGDNLDIDIPRVTWLKFMFLLGAMALMAAHIIFAYASNSYWESDYPDYGLTYLPFIINYTMQLYIVVREVRKCSHRHQACLAYWAIISASELVEIVVVENLLPQPTPSMVLQVFILLLNVGLVLLALLFDRPRRELLNVFLNPSLRSVENSVIRSEVVVRPHLYIEFNREFQITQGQGETVCEFKIAVYFQEAVRIVSKSEAEFLTLAEDMRKIFPNSPQTALPPLPQCSGSLMRYGEERQKIFESYLVELIRTDQFYCPPLLQFLELPPAVRMRLGSGQQFALAKKESLYSEEEERFRVPFFKVTAHKGTILVSNPDVLELVINKTKQEIADFHARLIEEKRLSMELFLDSPSEVECVHFFDIVVNRKTLWRSFAGWFGLGGQLQEKIYSYFDVWNIGFRNVEMKVVGNEKNFDREGKIHTLYLLSLQRRLPHSPDPEGDIVLLKKRYSDFFALNKEVLRFVAKNKLKADTLPDMPPKLSPFGSQTSPKSRVARFDHYIKELIRIEGINHCIKLLQFLEVDTRGVPADLYEPAEVREREREEGEESERSSFSDIDRTF